MEARYVRVQLIVNVNILRSKRQERFRFLLVNTSSLFSVKAANVTVSNKQNISHIEANRSEQMLGESYKISADTMLLLKLARSSVNLKSSEH